MYTPPNPNVDHLDPANWWPHYDMASDRRAIPAQAVVNLRAYNDVRAFTYLREEEGDPSSWAEVLELEEDLPTRVITVEFGPGAVRRLAPDQALYVAQGTSRACSRSCPPPSPRPSTPSGPTTRPVASAGRPSTPGPRTSAPCATTSSSNWRIPVVDFNALTEQDNLRLAIADRFIAWRTANQAQLQGAPTATREEYARQLRLVNRESPVRLDWAKFLAMPEAEFLAEFSGILRHANEDGTLRRGYRPGFVS